MAILPKTLAQDLLLLVASLLTLQTAHGFPQLSPPRAVPKSLSDSETLSMNTLKLLSSCYVRIVAIAPAGNLLDPNTADIMHFITATFNDLNTPYSVRQIGSTTIGPNSPDFFKDAEALKNSRLPAHIRRYNTKARNAQRRSSSAHPNAIVLVSPTTSSFELSPERYSNSYVFELCLLLERALYTLDVPKYFLIIKTQGRTNPQWFAKKQNYRSQHTFVLSNWKSLRIGQRVIRKASDVATCAQEPCNLKNFDGGLVSFFKTQPTQLQSKRVFEVAMLPEICGSVNATLMLAAQLSINVSATMLWDVGGAEALDLFSSPEWATTFTWLKGSETFPRVTFVMVTDPLAQPVYVYIQPMDFGTWLGTILSVVAVVLFTKSAVQDMHFANLIFDIPMTFLGQGATSSDIHKVRLVFTAWLLALIVINGGYTGLVYSHMTSPRSPPVPETVKHLNNYTAGDLISNARTRLSPFGANMVADKLIEADERLFKNVNPLIKKAARDMIYKRIIDGLPFFYWKFHIMREFITKGFSKRLDDGGWTEFESKLKFLDSKAADILMALVNPQVSLKHIPREIWNKFLSKDSYFRTLPPNHVYLGRQAEVRAYKLLLETLGLYKILSKEITLSLFSTVQPIWGTKSQGTALIQRKLTQLFTGGFVSMWNANASRFDVIDYFKQLQDDLRRHRERQLELFQYKMILEGEILEEYVLKDATPKMPPKLSNFLAKRNSMVHLFNDFVSATSVNLETVSGELRPVKFQVLSPTLIVFRWATVLACGLLISELLLSIVSLV